MAPREGCPLCSAGDWCSRLSWPGAPVTSFRWGRVVTINVSPGGATSSARRDAPRRSSGIPCVRTAAPGFRRRRTLPSLCHSLRTVRRAGARRERTSSLSCKASCGQPIPKSVAATPPVIPCVRTAEPWIRRRRTLPSSCHSLRADNRARASSRTHLSRRVRPPRVQTAHLSASSSPGRPHPADRHLRRGHSTRPGACPSGQGHSTPSGTAIPSPNAQHVPSRKKVSPHAQAVPTCQRPLGDTAYVGRTQCRAPSASRWHRCPRMAADTTTADTTFVRAALRTIVTIGDS